MGTMQQKIKSYIYIKTLDSIRPNMGDIPFLVIDQQLKFEN